MDLGWFGLIVIPVWYYFFEPCYGTVLTVVCLTIVPAFPYIAFLPVFPGFIAKPFRGVGVVCGAASSTHVLVS